MSASEPATPTPPLQRRASLDPGAFPPQNRSLDKAAFVEHLKKAEGFIPYMYKDTRENVTVGIGHLLRTARVAKTLPFFVRGTQETASPQQIESAFDKVSQATLSGMAGARAFKSVSNIDISEEVAKAHALKAMGRFIRRLSGAAFYPEMSTYPPTAQMALLDMTYTLGAAGTRDKFKKFTGAVQRRDWRLAAVESHRRDVGPGRNEIVRTWLEEALTDPE